jgi:regulator of sigma E protease
MIAKHAGQSAMEGLPEFLLFLTLLSANLAVINFLPIPVLDGGHMAFLTWEAIRGKPADERVQLVLSYLGLLFILGLMLWVIGLDVHLIPRE